MNQGTQPPPAPQPPQMFQLIVTGEEASLILGKLNTCTFQGFKEASMATTLFAKIQSASRLPSNPQPVVPPGAKSVEVPKAETVSSSFVGPTNVDGNGDSLVEEDNRPKAPLTSIDDAKKSVLSEEGEDDNRTSVPTPENDSIFSVVDRSTKKSGVQVGESDI